MRVRGLTFLIAVSWGAFVQAQLGPAQHFADRWVLMSVLATGDMDNDGLDEIFFKRHMDLTITLDTIVHMMEQTSPGHYSPAQLVVTATDPIAQIVLADMDGDGWRDLMLRTTELLWAQNLGGTSFGPVQTLAAPGWPIVHCQLADLDGDLDLDAVLQRNTPAGLHWIQNMGGGSFGTAASIYSGVCSSTRAADLDGDLDVDVVFTLNSAPDLIWLENDGSASFTQHVITTAGISYYALCVADMDGDLDNDLVAADESLGVDLLENLSPGTFAAAIPTGIYGSGPYYLYQGLTAVDRDGDGDQDLCWSVHGDICDPAHVVWWSNTGGGSMSGGGGYSADDGVAADGLCFTSGQLNGDIGIDLLWGDGDGLRVEANWITSRSCRAVQAMDADLDGDIDAVIGSDEMVATCADAKYMLAYHDNMGAGAIEVRPDQQFPSLNVTLAMLSSADLDGDTDEDLLVTHTWGGDSPLFFWLKNMGGGQFDSIASFGSGYMIANTIPLAGDVDDDGDRDVITPNNSALILHRNSGGGSFDPPLAVVSATNDVAAMGLGDLDSDGDLDYLWTYAGLYWSANDGTGVGGPAQSIDPSISYQDFNVISNIITVDLDLDMDSDLVVPIRLGIGYSVAVLLNNGGGSFSTPSFFPLTGFFRFKVADMTGDGYPDLLAPAAGTFHLLLNQGDGTFLGWQDLTTPEPVPSVGDMDIADIDGDGWPDVLVATYTSGMWFRNLMNDIPLAAPDQPSPTVLVLPNPTHDDALLVFGEVIDARTRIQFEDLQGRVVRLMTGNGTRELLFERGDLRAGIYMVRVLRDGTLPGTARVLVE